jgi:hypothetical protein
MKTFLSSLLLSICLAATVASSQEDHARYVTVVAQPTITQTNYAGGYYSYQFSGSNVVEIADFEVGELISAEDASSLPAYTVVSKDGAIVLAFPPGTRGGSLADTHRGRGTTVAGPARFVVFTSGTSGIAPATGRGALMTVKILPLTYSPQKSVTVAPGMGNVQIEMESSTNLLTWTAATNGVYNDDLKFFRVKLTTFP